MSIKTYPCHIHQVHSTGVTIVSCPAIGFVKGFVTDDHGTLVAADADQISILHASGSHE